MKAHHVPSDVAKKHCSSGEVKSKIVDNINHVDPGHLSPPERKTSVPATVNPISGTVPGVTVADLQKLKVNFDTEDQDLDVEVQIKSSEGSEESTETSFNAITPAIVPDPQPKMVDGFLLSDLKRLRKTTYLRCPPSSGKNQILVTKGKRC